MVSLKTTRLAPWEAASAIKLMHFAVVWEAERTMGEMWHAATRRVGDIFLMFFFRVWREGFVGMGYDTWFGGYVVVEKFMLL